MNLANPTLLRRLQKHRQYRQIIDAYEQCQCAETIAQQFMLTQEEAALMCGIIQSLKENDNND